MGCGCAKRARKLVAVAGYKAQGEEWVNPRTGHAIPDKMIERHHARVALNVIARSLTQGIRASAWWTKVQWECVTDAMAEGESLAEIEQRASDFLGHKRERRSKAQVAKDLGVAESWIDYFTDLAISE